MALSFSRYVSITSGVEGAPEIPSRSFGGCIITTNALVPTGKLLTFNTSGGNPVTAIGQYFGTTSEEYLRAVFYFSFISKNTTQPQVLSYWNWNNDAATGSLIFGTQATYALSSFTGVTTGDFSLTMGGFTFHMTGINLSSAGSLSAVASDIQTAIRAETGGGSAWTGATVSYDATNQRFDLVSGATGADTISVTAGVTTDVASLLGWLPPGAILSNGTAAQTLAANLAQLNSTNNNFGSFCFTTALAIEANIQAAAAWNYALVPNVQYLFCWPVSVANATTWQATIAGTGGHCGTILSPQSGAYAEMEPMAVLAATNYQAQNSVQNYMYQQFNDTASVTTDSVGNTLDAALINYYGQTEVNGQNVSFYQRGYMSGGQATDPSFINLYVNEMWLKSAMTTSIINLFLALSAVGANNTGRAQLMGIIQSIITQALFNGTISVGKPLTIQQQLAITNTTGSNTAWQQVQNIGYWVNITFTTAVINGKNEFKAVYTLIYSKDDVINIVDGTNILI